ncbi:MULTISPECIES: hypothetical protein [unclassified Bradyrhizobium]|nr:MULTISPECIES: hypothetical protein [unclassified Bradyrhizobium]MDH2342748.1 hypothetical protein [Bradyrhizobium sp. SSUT77]MDH2352936.1 hypothetical protein [Bradyrhizobium sp. SSUT112]
MSANAPMNIENTTGAVTSAVTVKRSMAISQIARIAQASATTGTTA